MSVKRVPSLLTSNLFKINSVFSCSKIKKHTINRAGQQISQIGRTAIKINVFISLSLATCKVCFLQVLERQGKNVSMEWE